MHMPGILNCDRIIRAAAAAAAACCKFHFANSQIDRHGRSVRPP